MLWLTFEFPFAFCLSVVTSTLSSLLFQGTTSDHKWPNLSSFKVILQSATMSCCEGGRWRSRLVNQLGDPRGVPKHGQGHGASNITTVTTVTTPFPQPPRSILMDKLGLRSTYTIERTTINCAQFCPERKEPHGFWKNVSSTLDGFRYAWLSQQKRRFNYYPTFFDTVDSNYPTWY